MYKTNDFDIKKYKTLFNPPGSSLTSCFSVSEVVRAGTFVLLLVFDVE